MKHFPTIFLALLLSALLCGCELIKDDPIPPRTTTVEVPVKPAKAEAMPTAEFADWMAQYLDMSRYTKSDESDESVCFHLQQKPHYDLDGCITVEGTEFALPTTFDAVVEVGWNIEVGKADTEIGTGRALEATWRNESGKRMVLRAGNLDQITTTYRNLPLHRLQLVLRDADDGYKALLSSAPEASFLGLSTGSNLQDVLNTLGEPSDMTYGLTKGGTLPWLELHYQNSQREYVLLRLTGDGKHLTEVELSVDL